jgi:hypothetical protein
MYLFVYVPVAGHIAPASARNRIGPLSMRSTSKGGPVRARGCHWERCGSTLLHIISAIRVEAPGLDPTYPKWDRSQTRVSCRPSCDTSGKPSPNRRTRNHWTYRQAPDQALDGAWTYRQALGLVQLFRVLLFGDVLPDLS